MLSPSQISAIKAEIKRLQQAQAECQDSGIKKQIEAWIQEQKERLNSK
jgi:hypothetical protein